MLLMIMQWSHREQTLLVSDLMNLILQNSKELQYNRAVTRGSWENESAENPVSKNFPYPLIIIYRHFLEHSYGVFVRTNTKKKLKILLELYK